MLRDGFYFRSGGAISQRMLDFAADGPFCSPFRSCEMRRGGCEKALMCQRVVSQLRNGALATKIRVLKLWGFRRAVRSCEMRLKAAKWHSCAKGVFHKEGHGAAKSFRNQGSFLQRPPFGCEIS